MGSCNPIHLINTARITDGKLAGKLMQLMGVFLPGDSGLLSENNPFIAVITTLHSHRPGFDI